MPDILIIDDDPQYSALQRKILKNAGKNCDVASSGKEGLDYVRDKTPGIVLLDIHLRDSSGLEILHRIKEFNNFIEVIMITGDDDTKTAIDCIRKGAFEYLTKPVRKEELLLTIERAEQSFRLVQELEALRGLETPEIIGISPGTRQIREFIKKAAANNATVLITGETGTGKEVVARHIHNAGTRLRKPFVPVNCASIPDGLIASEFFGYDKGTFTGAYKDKKGFFERANTGTIFLDEIGDMPYTLQTALLRLMDDQKVTRVGGEEVQVDVRILCATNQNLEEGVRTGDFRADLFYRINVLTLHIPPLRERVEDIIPISEYFIKKNYVGKRIPDISPQGADNLLGYPWPGNIRELRNVVERELILSNADYLDFSSLGGQHPGTPYGEDRTFTIKMPMEKTVPFKDLEQRILEKALEINGGNITRTAAFLDLQRSSLRSKLKKCGLQ